MDSIKVLYLSDLHYKSDSILKDKEYMKELYDSINNNYNAINVLVISGDICDKGGNEQDYEDVVTIINDIIEKLNITYSIIVPGNHDISRDILTGMKGKKGTDENNLWKYTEKYNYFRALKNVKNLDLNMDKVIVCKADIDKNFLFLGINSNYKIGVKDCLGYIDIENLNKEMEELSKDYGTTFDNIFKIVVMHHYPLFYNSRVEKAEDNNAISADGIGNFDKKNWDEVKKIFNKYGVKIVLCGHVHGSQISIMSECECDEKEIYYSTIGSIGINYNDELSELIEYCDSSIVEDWEKEKFNTFRKNIYNNNVNVSVTNRHNTYGIIELTPYDICEKHYLNVANEGIKKWIEWNTKKNNWANSLNKANNPLEDGAVTNAYLKKETIEDIEKNIIDVVRKEKLFKSGHFHRKEHCVMSWIDTTVLLTNSGYLNLISNSIVNKFAAILEESNCVIGLGMKGAILMSVLRYRYPNKKYTYCPEDYNNYNEFENNLLAGSNIDKVVLLTDVVHSGKTIRDFLNHYQRQITDCDIDVISIFLTGSSDDFEPVMKDDGTQHMIKIKVNYLAKLPIINCGQDRNSCVINKHKLYAVYEM